MIRYELVSDVTTLIISHHHTLLSARLVLSQDMINIAGMCWQPGPDTFSSIIQRVSIYCVVS